MRLRAWTKNLNALIEQCLQSVYRHAFLFAGEPDEVVEATMAVMREQLAQCDLPPETLDSLFDAIRRCKAQIERGTPASVRRH
jgi:hypothetical protein